MTNYRILEKPPGQPWLLTDVRQYHFHDVAKYEEISPKEIVDIKQFRPKWGIFLPVIRWAVAMVTASIQKLTTKKEALFQQYPYW